MDCNAQQLNLTGLALSCDNMCALLVEGGPKALAKFHRLVTVRLNWTGEGMQDEDEDDKDNDELKVEQLNDDNDTVTHKFRSDNACVTVWQGLAAQRKHRRPSIRINCGWVTALRPCAVCPVEIWSFPLSRRDAAAGMK